MSSPGQKFRVVVVEDHDSLRELTKTILERSNRFEMVGEAADGEEAVAVIQATKPDLVLLDLKMPRRDGFQALPDIRRVSPQSKVVAYSMLQKSENESRVLGLGATAFIEKDVESSELVARLLSLLDGGRTSNGRGGGQQPRYDTRSRMPFLGFTVPRWVLMQLGPSVQRC